MSTDTILHWLLRTSIEGGALVLIMLAIRRAMGPRLTPGWRMAMWGVVALKLVLPASLPTIGIGTLWPSSASDRLAAQEGSHGIQSTVSPAIIMSSRSDEVVGLQSFVAGKDVVAAGSTITTQHALSSIGDRGLKPFHDRYAVMLVWMMGALAMLGTAVVREIRFHRVLARLPKNTDRHLAALVDDTARALRLRRTPCVLMTDVATVPAVAGLIRPVLLMPRDWSTQLEDAELDSILRHELLHLKHHDLWLNWAGAVLNAIHWFNPLVWSAVGRCQEDRELRCDERALATTGPAQRIAYGRVLLRLQEHFTAPPAIAGVAPCVRNHPPLRQRILMITQPASHRPWFHAVCFAALSMLVCLSFGSASAADEKPGRTREGERSREADATGQGGDEKAVARKGEADGMKKRGEGDGAKRTGARDGEGGKTGPRDGEGARKTGEGDGAKKPGMRDGEGGVKPGARDGEGARKSAEGDGAKRTGARDGEGTRKSAESEGARKSAEGEGARKSAEGEGARKPSARGDGETQKTGKALVMRVTDGGETIVINGEKVPHNRLRAFLSELLPEHRGDDVTIEADDDVPFKLVANVLDAARDSGAKGAKITSASKDR